MASEKESLELPPSSMQKPMPAPLFHPPTLTGKNNGSSTRSSDSFNSNNDTNSRNNSSSSSQKGKLILPTAIWILMVVGGLCFLSLLSSLNRTINTLDELIEIEQSNSRLADGIDQLNIHHALHNNEHNHKHHHHPVPSASSIHQEAGAPEKLIKWDNGLDTTTGDDEQQPIKQQQKGHSMDEQRISSSWLAMPPWTSLDKSDLQHKGHHHHHHHLMAEQQPSSGIQSMIDNMLLTASNGDGDEASSPIEGIIIASAAGSDNMAMPQMFMTSQAGERRNPMESMVEQLLMGPKNQHPASGERDSVGVPAITANIDKINININNGHIGSVDQDEPDQPDEVEAGKRQKAPIRLDGGGGEFKHDDNGPERNKVEQDNDERVESLANSIDSLMAKLVDGPSPSSNQEDGPGLLLGSPMELGSLPSPHGGHPNRLHGPRPSHLGGSGYLQQSEISPLGGLKAILENSLGLSPQIPSQLIISLDGNMNGADPSTPPRGPPFSPYELLTDHMNPLSHHRHHPHLRHPYNPIQKLGQENSIVPQPAIIKLFREPGNQMMDSDEEVLLKSLAQSLLPMQQENKQQQLELEPGKGDSMKQTNEMDTPSQDSIVFINGRPLINDKKQSLAMDEESLLEALAAGGSDKQQQKHQNDIKDLFSVFFGPAPNSELLNPNRATTQAQASETPKSTTTGQQTNSDQPQGPTSPPTPMEPQSKDIGELLGEGKLEPQPSEAPLLVTSVAASGDKPGPQSDYFIGFSNPLIQTIESKSVGGGEPTIRDDLKTLMESIEPTPSSSSSTTNGLKLPKKLELLMEGLLGRGSMLASPQFANDQTPMQVEAQSSGQGGRQAPVGPKPNCTTTKAPTAAASAKAAAPKPVSGGSSTSKPADKPATAAQSSGKPAPAPASGKATTPASGGGGSATTPASKGGAGGTTPAAKVGGAPTPAAGKGGPATTAASKPASGGAAATTPASKPASGGGAAATTPASKPAGKPAAAGGTAATPPPIKPIGFVAVPGPPGVGAPIALANRPPPPMVAAGQQSGSSPDVMLVVPAPPPPPPAETPPPQFGRLGSLLHALNNSTGGFVPRLLNRLNSITFPNLSSVSSSSPTPSPSSSPQTTPAAPPADAPKPPQKPSPSAPSTPSADPSTLAPTTPAPSGSSSPPAPS